MFPVEFNYKILNSLPLPTEHGTKRVFEVLKALIAQRTIPFFRNKKGSDLIQLARVKQSLSVARLEDEANRIHTVSVVTRNDQGWTINLHERVFDYMAFVTPLKPEFSLGDGSAEERKILAFVELMFRHEVEHILHPERKEKEILASDVDYAMGLRRDDPTTYRMLRGALADEMNGIRGERFLALFDAAERDQSIDCLISEIVNDHAVTFADLPEALLEEAFPELDPRVKTKILGECYRKSRSTSYTLVKRASSLKQVLRLFFAMMGHNQTEALGTFKVFKDRWGVDSLFQELDLPETNIEESGTEELFDLFMSGLQRMPEFKQSQRKPSQAANASSAAAAKPHALAQPAKSLKERIEEVRNDPFFPPAAMELIDKNKLNASGQSSAKYVELIETLLAIPWGNIRKIWVTPEDFVEGLNRSHYGLQRPKEIVSDFFSNLIWRYQFFKEEDRRSWKGTGSALLFVGPPGVGKTSLAISIAHNLGIPYHKISLGGMKDEADIRGYGFTYEGSKPGPIIQGLIKMGAMNGMFILDEADKTEKFAIATLLEILDPEQNHLFHDKYTQSTIDIDLSNCHFILTANTLETVPPAVLDRCDVIFLDRYSVEEKIAIARNHLIQKVREKYMISEQEIYFDAHEETDLLRYLIRNYTLEAGVRDLERIIRTLLLRIQRKEIIANRKPSVRITREKIREQIEEPSRPRQVNEDDRVGEMMGLGVNMEVGLGTLIPIQVTRVSKGALTGDGTRTHMSILHATGNIEKVMDESRKVATTAIAHNLETLGIDPERLKDLVHMHFMGASTKKDGPSAGGAIALALASLFLDRRLRRDVAMTGEIDTQGRITGIGGLGVKLETAYAAGCKTMIIPKENLHGVGGISRLPEALKRELQILTYKEWKGRHERFDYSKHVLQVIAVDHILQAIDIALIDQAEIDALDNAFVAHAHRAVRLLADSEGPQVKRLRVVVVTEMDELDTPFFKSGFCEEDYGCLLLVAPEIRESVLARLPEWPGRVDIQDYDPELHSLREIIENTRTSLPRLKAAPLRISLIAPHQVLRREGIRTEDYPAQESFVGLRPFASCCTVENAQISEARSITSRAYHQLARLDRELLEACPFLVKHDGIYMISLSFIPEKYRLDVKRAEEILLRSLTRWLEVMEGEEQETEQRRLSEVARAK